VPFLHKVFGEIIEYASDLIKVEHVLKQFLNVKGN